jgi:hypothetical protein
VFLDKRSITHCIFVPSFLCPAPTLLTFGVDGHLRIWGTMTALCFVDVGTLISDPNGGLLAVRIPAPPPENGRLCHKLPNPSSFPGTSSSRPSPSSRRWSRQSN